MSSSVYSCLALRICSLEGRYHGMPEWPPAPARLLQALLAGTVRGRSLPPDDAKPLAWLEALPPPVICAPRGAPQRGHVSYVPNNDGGAAELGNDPTRVIRIGKTIRPVLFDPAIPFIYVWELPEGAEAQAVEVVRLAEGLYQFGRGIDPAFAEGVVIGSAEAAALLEAYPGTIHRPSGPGEDGLACPAPGSLKSLVERHARFLRRLAPEGRMTTFTNAPRPAFARIRYDAPPARRLFELREPGAPGFAAVPAAQAGALVRGLIQQAAKRLAEALPGQAGDVERFLLGRGAGERDKARRVRVMALPTIRKQVDRAIRRVLVEVPGECPLHLGKFRLRPDDVAWAFSNLRAADADGELLGDGRLVPADDRAFLDTHYLGPATRWRSETPLALSAAPRRRLGPGDRKAGSEREREEEQAARTLRQALRQAGLITRATAIRMQREPFAAQGTRAEAFAEGTRFDKHALWHAEITFAAPVRGPLLLGDGRFCGLGLMVPVPEPGSTGLLVWDIRGGVDEGADPLALAASLRRALMALAAGERGRTPRFFSGHEADGRPAGADGRHGHVACLADLARNRLLLIAPHLFGHRDALPEERDHLKALARLGPRLSELRAGPSGRLELEAAEPGPRDPLLAMARVWESVTPYRVTRHAKRTAPEAVLAEDLAGEAQRHGLPRPAVDILAVTEGPRGGLSATARLTFARPVNGPVLLGRTLHQGGGAFARANA